MGKVTQSEMLPSFCWGKINLFGLKQKVVRVMFHPGSRLSACWGNHQEYQAETESGACEVWSRVSAISLLGKPLKLFMLKQKWGV